MDANRLDDFAKALATNSSRRHFLRFVAGGAVGGTVALLATMAGSAAFPVTVFAAGGKKCPTGTFRCGHVCCDASGDLVCVNGTCCVPPHCPA